MIGTENNKHLSFSLLILLYISLPDSEGQWKHFLFTIMPPNINYNFMVTFFFFLPWRPAFTWMAFLNGYRLTTMRLYMRKCRCIYPKFCIPHANGNDHLREKTESFALVSIQFQLVWIAQCNRTHNSEFRKIAIMSVGALWTLRESLTV